MKYNLKDRRFFGFFTYMPSSYKPYANELVSESNYLIFFIIIIVFYFTGAMGSILNSPIVYNFSFGGILIIALMFGYSLIKTSQRVFFKYFDFTEKEKERLNNANK